MEREPFDEDKSLVQDDAGEIDLARILDIPAIQSLMDDFFTLTRIGVAILDIQGRVLVATGWQDICTKFHRIHPETARHCLESDTLLSSGVEPGTFKIYRCKNHMWDTATPIIIGGEHLGRMAGAIAHHFNNQLHAVIENLELAKKDLPQGTKPVDALTQAMKAAGEAARVSGHMLTYVGQAGGKRELLDLAETWHETAPMLKAALPNNVVLETDVPLSGPDIQANAKEIHQVVTNLLTNSWEAMAGSERVIHVTIRTVPGEEIPPENRFPVDWQPEAETYAALEVRDTGHGVPEQEVPKLFDPFYSTKFTGRGLGLPVALGIVRAHGGCITVESRCGEGSGEPLGSVFRVFLPLVEGEVSGPSEKPIAVGDATQGAGTVLLIEDTNDVRQLGVRMLEHLGFTVLAAKDGEEGVDMFRERRDEIRFVLSDLTMPRMDGWADITALREIDPNVRIILASGYDETSVMSGDHAEQPQVFLGKALQPGGSGNGHRQGD